MAEKIKDEHLKYHTQRVVPRAVEIGEIQKQIQVMQERLQQDQGIIVSWNDFLKEEYNLGPNDRVDEEGNIQRA